MTLVSLWSYYFHNDFKLRMNLQKQFPEFSLFLFNEFLSVPIHAKNVFNFARMGITKNPSLNIRRFLSNAFLSVPIHAKNVFNFA